MTMPTSPWLDHGDGTLDLNILIESALYFATLAGSPAGHEVRTAALSINHLRPCTLESESLICRAHVVHAGPNFTVAEALVEDVLGRGVAHATGSLLIRPVDPPPPPPAAPLVPVEEPSYPTPAPYLRAMPPDVAPFPKEMLSELDGMTLLGKALAGDLATPPSWVLLGIRAVEIARGRTTAAQRTNEWLCGSTREVSAGVIGTLAHLVLSGVAWTLTGPSQYVGVVDQSIIFFRPLMPDGREFLARGRAVHDHGELIASTVDITDAGGNRVALGNQVSVLIDRRSGDKTQPKRVLATILFTDIVGSTQRAEQLGDTKWRELLEEHHRLARRQLHLFKGREVKTTGDGFLATFESPGQAVQCARAIRDGLKRLGLEVRIGVHTGECEVIGGDVGGVAVNIAARVQTAAAPGEILVSGTVSDLVSGSGIRFIDRGLHELKGIEGKRQLFAVDD
jgi:uncharacterized protein (TIGR00369 family)